MIQLASKLVSTTPLGSLATSALQNNPLQKLASQVSNNLVEQLANKILQQLLGGGQQSQQNGVGGGTGSGNGLSGSNALGGNGSGGSNGVNGGNGQGDNLLEQLIQQSLGQMLGESLLKQLIQGLSGNQQNQDAFSNGLNEGLSNPGSSQQSPGGLNSATDFNQMGNALGGATGNALGSNALDNAGTGMDALRELNASDAKGKTYHNLDNNQLPVAKEVGKFMDAHPETFGKSDQASWEKDVEDGRINDKMIDKFMDAKSMLQDAMSGTPNAAFQNSSLQRDAQSFAGSISKLAVEDPSVTAR